VPDTNVLKKQEIFMKTILKQVRLATCGLLVSSFALAGTGEVGSAEGSKKQVKCPSSVLKTIESAEENVYEIKNFASQQGLVISLSTLDTYKCVTTGSKANPTVEVFRYGQFDGNPKVMGRVTYNESFRIEMFTTVVVQGSVIGLKFDDPSMNVAIDTADKNALIVGNNRIYPQN
jgi:hypothetical protein